MNYDEILKALNATYGERDDDFYADLAFWLLKECPYDCEHASCLPDIVDAMCKKSLSESVRLHSWAMFARLRNWVVGVDEDRVEDYFTVVAENRGIRIGDTGGTWVRDLPLGRDYGRHEVFVVDGEPFREDGSQRQRAFNEFACDLIGTVEGDDLRIYPTDITDPVPIAEEEPQIFFRTKVSRTLRAGFYEVYETVYESVIFSRVERSWKERIARGE